MKTITFEVISLDVWGNPRDGWEVNNAFYTGREVILYGDHPSDKAIVKALKRAGEIKSGIRVNSIGIEGELDYTLYISDERRPRYCKGYGHSQPVMQLRRKEER